MDLAPKNLRVDGVIDYYNARLVLEGYKYDRPRMSWPLWWINQLINKVN